MFEMAKMKAVGEAACSSCSPTVKRSGQHEDSSL